MKTIEERAKDFALEVSTYMYCGNCDTCEKCKDYRLYVDIATSQKAIDDAELLKLKSAWEKESKINAEANYKQGYHDAVEKACAWLEKELQGIAKDELKENFLENEFKLILKSQVPNWLINFRKSMEE